MGTLKNGLGRDERTSDHAGGTDSRSGKEESNPSPSRVGNGTPGAGTGTQNAGSGQPPSASGNGEKRGRGRPAKAQEKGQANEKVEVQSPQVLTGTAEAPPHPGEEAKTKKQRARKVPKIDGKVAAQGLMEMVEVFTVTAFGYDAAFSPTEKFMIEEPLARVIERYGAAVGQYSGLIDPIMLLTGLGMYAIRLDNLTRERQKAKQAEAERRAEMERQAREMAGFEAGPGYQTMGAEPSSNGGDPVAKVSPDVAALVGGVHHAR